MKGIREQHPLTKQGPHGSGHMEGRAPTSLPKQSSCFVPSDLPLVLAKKHPKVQEYPKHPVVMLESIADNAQGLRDVIAPYLLGEEAQCRYIPVLPDSIPLDQSCFLIVLVKDRSSN